MIVRELLINFGARLDPDTLKKADSQVKNFAQNASGILHTILGIGFVRTFARVITGLTEMGSAVRENENVMTQAFQESRDEVEAWAQDFGDAAGRNKYALMQTAGVLGSILNPLMDKNSGKAAEMSKRLVELAVDLGSFYNVSDEQAGAAITAGLVGQMEPLRRFGVIMSEGALKAYALENGIRGDIKTMSQAEKTQLRYNFILEKTLLAHGDAIKTAAGYANASKALQAKIAEVGTEIGLKLIPVMGWLVFHAREGVQWFGKLARESHIVESALLTLGTVAGIVAMKLAGPFLPLLIALKAVVLLVDDLWTFLDGGDSLIGRFIDYIAGPGGAAAALDILKTAFHDVKEFIKGVFNPALDETGMLFIAGSGAGGRFGLRIREVFFDIQKAVKTAYVDHIKPFFGYLEHTAAPAIARFASRAWPVFKAFVERVGAIVEKVWDKALKPAFNLFLTKFLPTLATFAEKALPIIAKFAEKVGGGLIWVWENALEPLINFLLDTAIPAWIWFAGVIMDNVGPAMDAIGAFFVDVYETVVKVVEAIGEVVGAIINVHKTAADLLGIETNKDMKKGKWLDDIPSNYVVRTPGFKSYAFSAPGYGIIDRKRGDVGPVTTVDQKVEVNLYGTTAPKTAQDVAKRVSDEVGKQNRQMAAALKQRGKK